MKYFGKKKPQNAPVNLEFFEIHEDVCVLTLKECLIFAKDEVQITQYYNQKTQRKLMRLDEDSYQLIIKTVGPGGKVELIKCEDIKEVRYANECFQLLKLYEDVIVDSCVTIKYKVPDTYLWASFRFEAFDTVSAQKWVHTLRLLQKSKLHQESVQKEKEIFINRFPFLLESVNESRTINAKDLKVFLCEMLNYKPGTDELNTILRDEGLYEGDLKMDLSNLLNIYNKLIYDYQIIEEYFKDDLLTSGTKVAKDQNVQLTKSNFPLFKDRNTVLTVAEVDKFLEQEETSITSAGIINMFGSDGTLNSNQFLDYLYSEANEIFWKSETVDDLMDSPLSHYWIASSHNTFLTGNQLKSKSSVEAYVQALLSGCKCLELDVWDRQGTIMILHGYTLTTMVPAEEVLSVIDLYAFKVSPYPVILSIENHLGTQMQEKFAKMIKDKLKDKLLISPLQDGGHLPSPSMLKNKIILKDKKLLKDEYDYFKSDIIKSGVVYFESMLNANDWTKRVVIMSSEFLYFSYEDATNQDADDLRDRNSAAKLRPVTQKLSDLHLAEPWYWGDVNSDRGNYYISQYVKKMHQELGPDTVLTGDFAIRPRTQCMGEYVLLFLDSKNKAKKLKVQSRSERGFPRYYIEEYNSAPSFDSLYTLVKHYQRIAFSVEGVRTILRKPIEEPRNFEKEVWFHYDASLEDSEKRLRHYKINGAFLVREQPDNKFRLVFRCAGAVRTCRIRQDGRLWIIGNSQFEGLTKLVEYYKKRPLYVTKNNQQIKLTEPVPKTPIDQSSEPATYLAIDNGLYVTEENFRDRPDEVYEAEEDYRGRNDDELTFLKGAIIKNVDQVPHKVGWCTGDYGPRKRKLFPKRVVKLCDLEELEEDLDNPLGNMCEGMIQLKKSEPRLHKISDNTFIPHYISIKCEGREEYRLGFSQYEDMEKWFDTIANARKSKPEKKKVQKTKQSPSYSNLIVYAMTKPSPPEFTDEYLSKICYREMCSFKESKLETYTQQMTASNLIAYTNTCLARCYPNGWRANSSNHDPLLAWNYGVQLVALNYQTPDKPMQLNQGRFHFTNGRCGYVKKPEDMVRNKFDPRQDSFFNSVALFITVISGRMLFSEAGNLPKVRVSLEGLDCDMNTEDQETGPAKSSICPYWDRKVISLLCLNPDMAMLRFEVVDSNDFGDEKFIGHCTFPVKQLRAGYKSVPLYDGYGNRLPMAKLLVHVEKEILKSHDPERELKKIRGDILQLNEFLSSAEVTDGDISRLKAIEDKYFNLIFDKRLAELNNNGSMTGVGSSASSYHERQLSADHAQQHTRTLSRGKTYVRLSTKRTKNKHPRTRSLR